MFCVGIDVSQLIVKATCRSTLQQCAQHQPSEVAGSRERSETFTPEATFTRRSDGYNGKSCAADQQSEAVGAVFGIRTTEHLVLPNLNFNAGRDD